VSTDQRLLWQDGAGSW